MYKIDVNGPNGNTLTALGIATTVMRQNGFTDKDVEDLRRMVMFADSPDLARGMIEHATKGLVSFYVATKVRGGIVHL